jgi:hypothetical protein
MNFLCRLILQGKIQVSLPSLDLIITIPIIAMISNIFVYKKSQHVSTHLYRRFTPTTCTSLTNLNFVWENFTNLHKLVSFIKTLERHALLEYLNLTHFSIFWYVYRKEGGIPIVDLNGLTYLFKDGAKRSRATMMFIVCHK